MSVEFVIKHAQHAVMEQIKIVFFVHHKNIIKLNQICVLIIVSLVSTYQLQLLFKNNVFLAIKPV